VDNKTRKEVLASNEKRWFDYHSSSMDKNCELSLLKASNLHPTELTEKAGLDAKTCKAILKNTSTVPRYLDLVTLGKKSRPRANLPLQHLAQTLRPPVLFDESSRVCGPKPNISSPKRRNLTLRVTQWRRKRIISKTINKPRLPEFVQKH